MTAPTPTPGPWVVRYDTDVFTALGGARADGDLAPPTDGWQVADCSVGSCFIDGFEYELSYTEKRANARLIAAAPLMLEALLLENEGIESGDYDTQCRAREARIAAIAAATGESK